MPTFRTTRSYLSCLLPRRRRPRSRETQHSVVASGSAGATVSDAGSECETSMDGLLSFPAHASQADKPCPICFERLGTENISAGPCLHQAHTRCLTGWFRQKALWSCPVCRFPFTERAPNDREREEEGRWHGAIAATRIVGVYRGSGDSRMNAAISADATANLRVILHMSLRDLHRG